MRRTLVSAFAIFAAFAALTFCSPQKRDTPRETLPPGWTDAVRYRCAGIGEAGSTNTNKIRRRGIAKAAAVERILAHLGQVRNRAHGRRLPEIMRAMENLKMALRMRLGDDLPDPAVARRISEIIDRAAVEIERC